MCDRVKKVDDFETKWVQNCIDVVSYYNTNGNFRIPPWFFTVEDNKLVNWLHDQRMKFKSEKLTDDRINLLSNLQFAFWMQANVVGAKLTVPVAISKIFKYKKENGNISIPNKEPYRQLRRWITHANNASKKIIEEGKGNPNFTLPNLKLLNELGIIKLPTNLKLKGENHQRRRRRSRLRRRQPRCLRRPSPRVR
jgi:hypothetical protein